MERENYIYNVRAYYKLTCINIPVINLSLHELSQLDLTNLSQCRPLNVSLLSILKEMYMKGKNQQITLLCTPAISKSQVPLKGCQSACAVCIVITTMQHMGRGVVLGGEEGLGGPSKTSDFGAKMPIFDIFVSSFNFPYKWHYSKRLRKSNA